MTNKAYIVANEQQEREVLDKLEREGYLWRGLDVRPTEKHRLIDKPITIFARDDKRLTFDFKVNEAYLADFEIAFDGRKEEKMSDKYVVSQEFMNELNIWKTNLKSYDDINNYFVGTGDLRNLPILANLWASDRHITNKEHNNRLIAIIRWVNGEDVFEVEKPKKWVVRSKEVNDDGDKHYWKLLNLRGVLEVTSTFELRLATKFDTKEEAESWANSHQEVIEVEE